MDNKKQHPHSELAWRYNALQGRLKAAETAISVASKLLDELHVMQSSGNMKLFQFIDGRCYNKRHAEIALSELSALTAGLKQEFASAIAKSKEKENASNQSKELC